MATAGTTSGPTNLSRLPPGRYYELLQECPGAQKAVYDRIFHRYRVHTRASNDLVRDFTQESLMRLLQSPSPLTDAPESTSSPTEAWYAAVMAALVSFATGQMRVAVVAHVRMKNGVKLPRPKNAVWQVQYAGALSKHDDAILPGPALLPQVEPPAEKVNVIRVMTLDAEAPFRSDHDTVRNLSDEAAAQAVEDQLDYPKAFAALRQKISALPDSRLVLQLLDVATEQAGAQAVEGVLSGDGFSHQGLLPLLQQAHPDERWDGTLLATAIARLGRIARRIRVDLASKGLLPFVAPPDGRDPPAASKAGARTQRISAPNACNRGPGHGRK